MNLAPTSTQSFISHDENEATERLAKGAKVQGADTQFFEALYRNAAPEDINRYTPAALATLATLVKQRLDKRKTGNSLVDLFNPSTESKAYPENECVLVAINDDMPFLFDSLTAELQAQSARVRAVFHPIVQQNGQATSVIVAVLDPVMDSGRQQAIADGARAVFAQVWEAVRDWQKMMGKLGESIAELRKRPPAVAKDDLDEYIAFLEWLGENHFTFLGCRDFRFHSEGGGRLEAVDKSSLGVLTDSEARVLRGGADRASLTPQIREFLMQPEPLIITKSNERSRCIAASIWIMSASRRSTPRATSSASGASSASSLRAPIAAGPRHSAAQAQDREGQSTRRPRAQQP